MVSEHLMSAGVGTHHRVEVTRIDPTVGAALTAEVEVEVAETETQARTGPIAAVTWTATIEVEICNIMRI